MDITQSEARAIIEKVGSGGEPPEHGAGFFSAGIDTLLETLRAEYFDGLLTEGLSVFKLLVGDYGAGKTHFLYCLREMAWECGYVVSLVSLNPRDCPFDKLELVYKEIAANLTEPPEKPKFFDTSMKGIDIFVENWWEKMIEEFKAQGGGDPAMLEEQVRTYLRGIRRIESSSFKQAVKEIFKALQSGDDDRFNLLQAWLKGEPVDKKRMNELYIFERIDKTTAFRMIRSLCQWVREIGYNGLALLFDEGERQASISGSKSKKIAYDNLRQVVDECGHSTLPGSLFCYAVPNSFKEEIKDYEALRQRLLITYPFSSVNPSSVEINLESLENSGKPLLTEIGLKLLEIYKIAMAVDLEGLEAEELVPKLADRTLDQVLDISHRRIFVKLLIEALHLLRAKNSPLNDNELDELCHGVVLGLAQSDVEEAEGEW